VNSTERASGGSPGIGIAGIGTACAAAQVSAQTNAAAARIANGRRMANAPALGRTGASRGEL
jgi:hypothetical protein